LQNCGKTSILNVIRGVPDASVAPTMGFNKHDVELGTLKLSFFDLGGSPKIRNTWANYFARAHGVIFVVDSSDPSSLEECKKVYEEAVGHSSLALKPILILVSKRDVTGCLDGTAVRQGLALGASPSGCIRVQECSKNSKSSIDEGTAWLYQSIVSQWRLLSPRVEADVAAEEQKMREAFAERKRQVELKKAQRLKDEEARLAVEASQGTTTEVHALTAFDSSHCNQFRPNYIIRFSPFSGTSATCCCAASSTAMTHRNNQG
jgi:GTPase SAR1 family protein